MKMGETIDIMRTSASRPNFLRESTEALRNMLKYSGELRWIIHEDCLHKDRSNEVMEYIKSCGLYDVYGQSSPPLGQGGSLTWLMSRVSSKYVINFEDDFKPIKEIDIDMLIALLDNNPDINQIAFHKRPIMSERGDFKKKHIVRNGIDLVTNPHWAFTPSIFRLSYLKPKWVDFGVERDPHWKMNDVLKGYKRKGRDADWVIANTGTYFLGRWKNKKFLKENGGTMDKEEYDKIDNGFYAEHIGREGGSVREGRYGK